MIIRIISELPPFLSRKEQVCIEVIISTLFLALLIYCLEKLWFRKKGKVDVILILLIMVASEYMWALLE